MEQVSEILKKISKIKVDITQKKYTFRLSMLYCVKAFLFLAIIVAIFFMQIHKFAKQNLLQKAIWVILLLYIIFYLYRLFKYKIRIENDILYYEKSNIDLKKVNKIQLMRTRVGGSKYDNCLALYTDDKVRYIVRLNISNKYLFIALVSRIAKVKVEA